MENCRHDVLEYSRRVRMGQENGSFVMLMVARAMEISPEWSADIQHQQASPR